MKVEHGPDINQEDLGQLKQEMEQALSTRLRVRPNIEFVAPNSLLRDPSKKVKLIEKNY
jgi:phenylacetate-coenzyme A ligase PaaK-like adenylate-forming protein